MSLLERRKNAASTSSAKARLVEFSFEGSHEEKDLTTLLYLFTA
jgi:hypothetical protein